MRTVLVVDDEPPLRSLAEAFLQDLGYSAVLAESGRAAIQLLLQDPDAIAAVLLDMTMPGLGSEETFRLLREIRPDLPVIILSGLTETAVRERFGRGTIAGCIEKPYTDIELDAALTQALRQPISPAPPKFTLVRLSEGDLGEIRQEYLATCNRDLPKMIDLLAAREFEPLQVMGHSLKGSGGAFGFPELTQVGKALELYARASDSAACGEQLTALKGYLDHLGAEHLPSGAGGPAMESEEGNGEKAGKPI